MLSRLLDKARLRPTHPQYGVRVAGYAHSHTGLGEAARLTASALQAAGVPTQMRVVAHPSGNDRAAYPQVVDARRRNCAAEVMLINPRELLRNPPRSVFGSGARIGYWQWELSEYPDEWVAAERLVDEIWTASHFAAAAMQAKFSRPVHIVPHPVIAATETNCVDRSAFGIPESAFVVLCALDFDSGIERKNPFAAVAAFRAAFPSEADVLLLIKARGRSGRDKGMQRLADAVDGDERIRVLAADLTRGEMQALQRASDVFLSLHRSEGFGLHLAECMLQGIPVVATGYSGNLDFMDDTCALLVGYDLVDVLPGAYPGSGQRVWAEPRIDSASELLQRCHSQPEYRRGIGAAAQARIRRQLSPEAVGATMRNLVDALLASKGWIFRT